MSGSNVRFLDFNPTWLKPQNSNNRAYGFQLRCLRAFIAEAFRSLFSFSPSRAGGEVDVILTD